jgi:hypothetical protein
MFLIKQPWICGGGNGNWQVVWSTKNDGGGEVWRQCDNACVLI